MLQVFQKFLTRLFESPIISTTALDVLLDVVQMLKYHLYLVLTSQNDKKLMRDWKLPVDSSMDLVVMYFSGV